MSLLRTEYGSATEADLPGLARIMSDDLAPMMPAFFATQESTREERYDWWTRFLRQFFVASTDATQRAMRGSVCPKHLWRAKQYYADGTANVVGLMVFGVVPRAQDREAHKRLDHATSLLPNPGAPPPGFNPDAFDDCFAAADAWTAARYPTHSVLIVHLFAVDKSTRGTGVGAALLGQAKDIAAHTPAQPGDVASGLTQAGRPGVPLALHAVLSAVGFYKKQGLREEQLLDLGRCNQKFLGMHWQAA